MPCEHGTCCCECDNSFYTYECILCYSCSRSRVCYDCFGRDEFMQKEYDKYLQTHKKSSNSDADSSDADSSDADSSDDDSTVMSRYEWEDTVQYYDEHFDYTCPACTEHHNDLTEICEKEEQLDKQEEIIRKLKVMMVGLSKGLHDPQLLKKIYNQL